MYVMIISVTYLDWSCDITVINAKVLFFHTSVSDCRNRIDKHDMICLLEPLLNNKRSSFGITTYIVRACGIEMFSLFSSISFKRLSALFLTRSCFRLENIGTLTEDFLRFHFYVICMITFLVLNVSNDIPICKLTINCIT